MEVRRFGARNMKLTWLLLTLLIYVMGILCVGSLEGR